MASFKGFGRDSGPSAPPKSLPLFGQYIPLPPTPHNATSTPPPPLASLSSTTTFQRPPRDLDAPEEPFFSSYDWIHPGSGPTHTPKQNAPFLPPPRLGAGNNTTKTSGGQPNLRLATSVNDMIPGNAVSLAAPKRTRSPPSLSMQGFDGKSYEGEDDTERELQAKAKRLARFKSELSFENAANASMKSEQPKPVKPRLVGDDTMEDDVDNEQLQATGAIVGLCPDMCPETEREERERKGDLDQYERINGDRNQSSQDVAVKKYTRTAEREPELIRPMPILQKTMDYLLSLLDQPYDDRFLGLYNFLWDRMRAIRMDLRMQHIFNLEAISMLEQMIRLHIIAMHELCEYTKGEGFSEGFDAHLNIEQMNKTSVELFQMYDDHRKRGVDVPTEKEFRGYYALLKLDKHPGYKVEPAELSLDLAKMTPEIRKTPEIVFAREVARSCRVGNFIAFFRLARKATYLQACLMHAHFSKLRTQALASLHCGLQNNQGIPVAFGAKWLGLEEEGAEDLLEYHGFSIKEYEEPYMVKEGPFLNSDKDYPTRCSELVHLKKSKTIVDDILHLNQEIPQPSQDSEQPLKVFDKNSTPAKFLQKASFSIVADEEMPEIEASSSPRSSLEFLHKNKLPAASRGWHDQTIRPISHENVVQVDANDIFNKDYQHNAVSRKDYQHNGEEYQLAEKGYQPWIVSSPKLVPDPLPFSSEWMPEQTAESPAIISPRPCALKSFHSDERTQAAVTPSDNESVRVEETSSALVTSVVASDVHHDMVIDDLRHERRDDAHQAGKKDLVISNQFDNEVADAKLRLLLRLWKRRSLRKGEMRKQYRLAANAALNSLPLGPPLKLSKARPGPCEVFNIDEIMSQRYDKYDHSWSTINVADLVGNELLKINANSHCICWKIALYSQAKKEDESRSLSYQSSIDCWLHSKIMPSSRNSSDDGLVTASPGLVIWRKWIIDSSVGSSCCLSVIKDLSSPDSFGNLAGASGIIFLVSDLLSWEHQKMQLHNLVGSLPSGPATSLLVLSGSNKEEFSDQTSIFHRLGLSDLDRSRIRSFLVVNVYDSQNLKDIDGYYSDEQLREGLKWLATESLPQPALCYVKTRELVLAHLNSSLESFDRKGFHEIDPNQCISAFNEALNKAIENIVTAAQANPLGWPCPELSLLDNSTEEHRVVKWFLPSVGWNSQEKIQSLVSALGSCRLPDFLDDTSFLHRGSHTIDEFEEQRLHLRDCLISYLNQSSMLMNFTLSLKEASAMLQMGARLKLHGTAYYLVPNWVLIFRRVFNWQLNRLSGKSCSIAYVLEQNRPLSMEQTKGGHVDNSSTIASGIYQPSLDEMVEVSFKRSPGMPISLNPQPEAFKHVPASSTKKSKELNKISFSVPSQLQEVEGNDVISHNFKDPTSTISSGEAREADKLSRLLDQCNMLQNKIAEKLSIYF